MNYIPMLAVFAPLIGFILAFASLPWARPATAQIITCVGMIIATMSAICLFLNVIDGHFEPFSVPLMTWFAVGTFEANWALRVDTLSIVMMNVVAIVSTCVHVYSVGYMSHDAAKARFMSYLSLFTFAMMMLISADNLLQLFFGWEGVGLASYLLIGFWNHKDSANSAAVKAFVVNRVGDFGLALGVFTTFLVFGSLSFDTIFANVANEQDRLFNFLGWDVHALTLCGILLFIGAMGKSAQLGLHTWLPDAMEGPTPVSALIHAATMVTAGVFLVARMSPLYEYAPFALEVITIVGAMTAIVAATIGLTQFDIKRVIAYSTMSQLGYMFFALGVSAYSAAIFHLMTHAFFKALLFLGAGSVIHAMSDEQDMRNMGGIWRKIPFTYTMMWIGSLALAGIPLFAGYYSKDIILESAWASHSQFGELAFWLGIAAALLTAFYSWRLIFMTFHGKPRAKKKVMDHIHESPLVMTGPLLVLAVGAMLAGFFFYQPFVGSDGHHGEMGKEHFWQESLFVMEGNDSVGEAHHVEKWVKKLPIYMGLIGIFLAFVFYKVWPKLPAFFAALFLPLHRLFFNKYYFDELYQVLFVNNAMRLGRLFWRGGDGRIIDRMGPDGLARRAQNISWLIARIQSGFVYHYAFVMFAGLLALTIWFMFERGLWSF